MAYTKKIVCTVVAILCFTSAVMCENVSDVQGRLEYLNLLKNRRHF